MKSKNLLTVIINKDILLSVLICVTVIAGGLFLGSYNNKVVPLNKDTRARYVSEPNNKLSFISDWDGPDYLSVANNGYTTINTTNFFPLYPLLTHAVNRSVTSPLYSALIVAWLSFIGAVYFYLKIIKSFFKVSENINALKGVLLFVLFPTSVFLFASYTEGLFAFLALGAIYFALQKKYLYSALFLLFATATHITGVFLLMMLGLMLLEQKEKIYRIISYMVIGSLGIVAYMIYLYEKFGKPLAFITAQKNHGWLEGNVVLNLINTFNILNLFFVILILVSVIYWWKRKKSFSIYSLSFLIIPIIGGEFGGFNRYVLMAFPVQFMLFDKYRDRSTLYTIVIIAFSILWTFTLLQYSGGYTGS